MKFRFLSAVRSKPNILKSMKGEDSYFISRCKRLIAVADGVHFSNPKIDSSLYSKDLIKNIEKNIKKVKNGDFYDTTILLHESHLDTKPLGSSTAVVIGLHGVFLDATMVGDSGFMIYRKHKKTDKFYLFFRFHPMQFAFNYPFQLSLKHDITVMDDANSAQLPMEHGDLIILGTDGLFDNVFDDDITDVLNRDFSNRSLEQLSQTLLDLAYENSRTKAKITPFQREAERAGFLHEGGKRDDITIICSYCVHEK